MSEEGLPMHPAYVGIHYMELESSLDACQDKVCLVGFLPQVYLSFWQIQLFDIEVHPIADWHQGYNRRRSVFDG